MYQSKPEMGRYDASYGTLLLGDGSGSFEYMPAGESGIKIDRAVREIRQISSPKGSRILVANNNDHLQLFRKNSE
jgi:hypothetical protein